MMLNDTGRKILEDLGLLWPLLAAAGSLCVAFWQMRQRKRAEAEKDHLEKEAKLARNRKSSPYLEATDFMAAFVQDDESEIMLSIVNERFSLDGLRAGALCRLHVINRGAPVREFEAVVADGQATVMGLSRFFSNEAMLSIEYHFNPDWIGRDNMLQLSFINADGYHDNQKYRFRHGSPKLELL